MGQGAGLSGARPRDDQHGTLGLEDRLSLDVVEAVEEGGCDAHATMLARARDHTGQDGSDLDLRQMSVSGRPVTVDGMQERSPVRAMIRAFGFGCLMTAAGLAGYTAWLLWGTGLETARAQEELRTTSTPLFEHPTPRCRRALRSRTEKPMRRS